jgi:hypothetical protein
MKSPEEASLDASTAMLSAALAGFMCIGSGACIGDEALDPLGGGSSTGAGIGGAASSAHASGGTEASATASGSTSDGSSASSSVASTASVSASSSASSSAMTSSSTGSQSSNPHTPIPDTACPSGISPTPMVTSTMLGMLTEQQFHDMCDQAGGIFEIQPLCGGSNACRGFAYDSGQTRLTEHTCQGTNTCAGYNCVVCS